ncbi:hypothetical protein D3C84_796210 [compost metagenome]
MQLVIKQVLAGRAIVSTGDDAVHAADIGRLASAGHVHVLQDLGRGLAQVELTVYCVAFFCCPILEGDQLITDIGSNDELVKAQLIIRHLEPTAVVIQDDQGSVVRQLDLVVTGVPYLCAELFHLDVG